MCEPRWSSKIELMKRLKKIILISPMILLLLLLMSCGQLSTSTPSALVSNTQATPLTMTGSAPLDTIKPFAINKLELPKMAAGESIITHAAYTISYNAKYHEANWVAYELTKEETNNVYERAKKFVADPYVTSVSASDQDYKNSHFDKGHLAPAADMGWSALSMKESFYYSNVSPQRPEFNRGIWKKLEELVRTWAYDYKAIYVVTGPVLSGNLPTIGTHQIAIPNYFFKVILDYTEPGINGIGFILPNQASSNSLSNFAVTIDSVEKLTGLDFFPALPDAQEKTIESTLCKSCWTWTSTKTGSAKVKAGSATASLSTQCLGITKKGARCKRHTSNANGCCFQHGGF